MSDNGTEFLNQTMVELCETTGAVHQTTTEYTPEENSLVEKMHYVLMGKVRALLAANALQGKARFETPTPVWMCYLGLCGPKEEI